MISLRFPALALVAVLAAPLAAQAQSPREHLQDLTAQLQKAPADEGLREAIIRLTLTLDPKPSVPDAATLAEGAGEYAFKNAQSASDYSDSARQYEKALLIAPWIAADYFNCGVAYEKAGDNKNAIRNLNLYLLAAPSAEDLQAVKKRIGGLQYAEQKAEDGANRQVNTTAAAPAPTMQRFDCQSISGGALGSANSFDFSTGLVSVRILNRDGSYATSAQPPLPFREVGRRLIWSDTPPDPSVNSLDRDTGVIDVTDPIGRLWRGRYQCTTSAQ